MRSLFLDRIEAGRYLAARLAHLKGPDVVVLGLPRGGVPVAAEVARALGAPLDILLVRKIGVPYQPELAMGAIGEGGVRVIEEDIVHAAQVTREGAGGDRACRAKRTRASSPRLPRQRGTAGSSGVRRSRRR